MHSLEYVRSRLAYNPATGVITWLSFGKMANRKFKVGDAAAARLHGEFARAA